jgi:hypothetical protein
MKGTVLPGSMPIFTLLCECCAFVVRMLRICCANAAHLICGASAAQIAGSFARGTFHGIAPAVTVACAVKPSAAQRASRLGAGAAKCI